MTDISPQIQELLGRNVSAEAILDAGSRLRADSHAGDFRSAIFLRVGEGAPPEVRLALAEQLRRGLASMALDVDHLAWILGASDATLGETERIAAALSALRLEVHDEVPVPFHQFFPDTWVTVTGPDILIDLLLQPLSVLSTCVRAVFGTWQHVVDRGMRTYWLNKLPDEVPTAIELFVLRQWGLPLLPFESDMSFESDATDSPNSSSPAELALLDLEPVADVSDLPWECNPDPTLNQTAKVTLPARHRGGLADRFYGHIFSNDFWRDNEAPYRARRTPMPAPYGVLSVPFREIPRFHATSGREVVELCTSIAQEIAEQSPQGTAVLFRGQTAEYTLPRNAETLEALYGRSDVIEPSLLPSGSRRTSTLRARMAFGSLVELASAPQIADSTATWRSFPGDQRKVAFAQHYGLATYALDLTDQLGVALWFALTDLARGTGSDYTATSVDASNASVLYILQSGEFDSKAIDIVHSPSSRPARQRGWVSAGSWGWQSNRAAKHLAAAVYFPGSIRDGLTLPDTADLFSPPDAESLTLQAHALCTRAPSNPVSDELARDLYSVVY